MQKADFKKTLKIYFKAPAGEFAIVDIPSLRFLMVDGEGNPNTSAQYAEAVEALFSLSYKLKFMSKAAGRDYVVAPLQGLWWADDMADFQRGEKDRWSWTMMIMQPDWITSALLNDAIGQVRAKGQVIPATMRLEPFDEGQCVQTLHIGSYDDEAPTIRKLHAEFLPNNGLIENGKHHEIYLSDPRRTAPEKLKTILRQPVRAKKPGEKTNWH
jgi:hypothetical protein